MKLQETTIPMNFGTKMMENGWEWDTNDTEPMYHIILQSLTSFLSLIKSKETKTAIKVTDLKGNTKLMACVTYHPNEDEEMPGNWSYEMSFTDIEGAENIFNITDTQFQKISGKVAMNLYGFQFMDAVVQQLIFETGADCIKEWLDVNAAEGQQVDIECDGYFIASVGIEENEKVFSIVPDGAMKRIIKDDAMLEQQ